MQPAINIIQEQPRPMSWWNFVGSVLFAFFGTSIIAGIFIYLPLAIYSEGVTGEKQLSFYESLAGIGAVTLQIILLLFFIYNHKALKQLLQPIFNLQALKKGSTYGYLLLFFVLNIILSSIVLTYVFPEATTEQDNALNLEVLGQYKFLLIINIAILVPIFEELIFRGMILRFFQTRFPFWIAAVGSSFIFGIAHTYSVGVMAVTFILGMLMAILCKKTNSIVPAILLHMMNNMLATLQ
ncbi:lysostaphin resistance A-like protein [Bacillus manliponensis]|uniref:CPBP family intramembrane glutamic endopeptidase n=1 Tax=Bacillus manliponensis TaxID=574376 RepID=UPI003512541B